MKHKKIFKIMIIAMVLLTLGWLAWVISKNKPTPEPGPNNGPNSAGRQVCPDAWYDNRMPGPAEETRTNSQYFVINGERVELHELDVEWVKANCAVNEPIIVQ